MENKNNINNTNEAVNTQVQNVQAPAENQQPEVQVSEKKPSKLKAIAKKVAIGTGAVAAAALCIVGGFEAGKHSASKESSQTPDAGSDSQAE